MLEKSVSKKSIASRKKHLVFCRLKGQEYLKTVSHIILDVLQGKAVDKITGGR
eukprot:jgi/Antlo1/1814/22